MTKRRGIRKANSPSNGESLELLKCRVPKTVRKKAWDEKLLPPYTPIANQVIEGLELRNKLTRSEKEEILSRNVPMAMGKGKA